MFSGWDVRTAISKKEIAGGQGESSSHVMESVEPAAIKTAVTKRRPSGEKRRNWG